MGLFSDDIKEARQSRDRAKERAIANAKRYKLEQQEKDMAREVAECYLRKKNNKPGLPNCNQNTSNEILSRLKLKSEIIDDLVDYYNDIPNTVENADKLQTILEIIKIILNK